MTPPTPSVPYPAEFEDLSLGQQTIVQNVSRLCLRKIAEAKTVLNTALVRPNPRVMTHFKIEGVTQEDKRDLQIVVGRYNRISGILLGHERLRFDGELTGPAFNLGALIGKEVTAYVRSTVSVPVGMPGEVKLVKDRFFACTTEQQARIVIHEIGHRFLGLKDVKYYRDSHAISLSRQEALVNADTYAYFALPRPGAPSLIVGR